MNFIILVIFKKQNQMCIYQKRMHSLVLFFYLSRSEISG